jgi:flagellar biosynthesis protein FlhF
MQINKYKARSISEAMAKVKNELGPDAIILATKKLKDEPNGYRFEITALPAETSHAPDQYSELKSDLMSIKEMICLLNTSGGIDERLIMNPAVLSMYARLIKNGVSDQCARVFLDGAGVFNAHIPDNNKNHIQRSIAKEILKFLETDKPKDTERKGQKLLALVGTTGVGKTTTIAKLAAQFMLKDKKKVGLISIDNYRIGAMEQLKAYADILGIPCFPAFNRKDLLFVLKRLEKQDVILIDTAGQSQYDSSRISELQRMITEDLEIRSHLLLSVSTSEDEMHRTALNFSPLKFQNYIFTKIDEAQNRGSIINQLMKLNLPISYITNGQNVPEDIESASKEKIVNLILNPN